MPRAARSTSPTNSTFYFFMAVNRKPFSNLYARQGVLAALDLRALSRLDSGALQADCHLIPPGDNWPLKPITPPVRQTERGSEHGARQAADEEVGDDRPAGDRVGRVAQPPSRRLFCVVTCESEATSV